MAKAADMQKAKERKQKKIVIIGGVLFLALLAFQVPRTLKMMNPEPPPAVAAPPPVAAPAPTSLAPPTLAGAGPAPAPGATGAPGAAGAVASGLEDSDPLTQPEQGQLVSFGRFDDKDPFVQQINRNGGGPASSTGATTAGTATSAGGASETPAKPKRPALPGSIGARTETLPDSVTPPAAVESVPGNASAEPAAPPPTSAVILVNGEKTSVGVTENFPQDDPVFVLVALTKDSAKVGIAGGSYTSGAAAITLRRGKTVTLQNTADGSRYTLRLVGLA